MHARANVPRRRCLGLSVKWSSVQSPICNKVSLRRDMPPPAIPHSCHFFHLIPTSVTPYKRCAKYELGRKAVSATLQSLGYIVHWEMGKACLVQTVSSKIPVYVLQKERKKKEKKRAQPCVFGWVSSEGIFLHVACILGCYTKHSLLLQVTYMAKDHPV